MDNMGVKEREQISREFYPQGGLNSEMAEQTPIKTAQKIGEVVAEAAIFSKPEAPAEASVFDEMTERPQTPEFGKIETVENSERQRNLDLGKAGFTSYTKEFSSADGKIVRAEIENLKANPFAGYEALQRDRMEYLKSKFNREID